MKIIGGKVFNSDHRMEKKDLCFENGVICESSNDGEYDADGCYVLPGFIDTHIHGAFGEQFYHSEHNRNLNSALNFLSSRGVTSILATLATETEEEYIADCKRFVQANDDRIIGIHLEGPFINPVRKGGLHPDKIQLPNLRIPSIIDELSGGLLKIVSMAPEVEGSIEVIKELVKKGIRVSIAHTDATFNETINAIEAGATRVTHLYNAMRPFVNRDPGILGCALTDNRLNCELICDLHHVSVSAIKLAVKSKGIENITMISDTGFFCGMPEDKYYMNGREYYVSGGFARLPDGTISGSACTLADGAKNMFGLGFNPEEIAIMACVNPAKAAGCSDRGELKNGCRADVIILDKDFNVRDVFVKGEKI